MKSRKSLLKKSQLYLILDRQTLGNRSLKNIDFICANRKIDLVQLRDKKSTKARLLKDALKLSGKLAKANKLFIINDSVDIACACGADGVHLGQDDLPLKLARRILGQHKIIGISCHNLAQAQKAQADGADYIGIGPIFKTATKPGYPAIGTKVLKALNKKIKIPYFAIGGINHNNLNKITAAKAKRVAVCRQILKAKDYNCAIKQLLNKLK